MRKRPLGNYILIGLILLVALLFVAKFSGPVILRLYIESGVGSCQKIPILCMVPAEEIISPNINKEYIAELLPYEFPKMVIFLPKGFSVVQEKLKKIYYKKNKRLDSGSVIYLLTEEPNFFVKLFPQLEKQGIKNDYEFIKRTMYADIKNIKNLTDAFFTIMKGIFIPNLGDQKNVKMLEFTSTNRRGFINYSLSRAGNYFDGNIIDSQGNFFKIYIKDRALTLDLDKVLAIVSTVNRH